MRIVFVCTTNVWGSAMAELISRQLLAEWDPDREKVQVFSAGVRADVGAPMSAVAQEVLADRGIDASKHRARWMSSAILSGADLTLTMGGTQRDAALALNPRGLRTTFTIREAIGLLDRLRSVRAPLTADFDRHGRALVAEMSNARRFRSVSPGADDLADLPLDKSSAIRELTDQLIPNVVALIHAVVLPVHGGQSTSSHQEAHTVRASAVA